MDTPGLFVDDRPKDDDEVSVNSTLLSQHDSDEEWNVEGILYQMNENGKDFYLVEWTGFPIEEATWEPEENVLGELLEEWRATQRRQAQGKEKVFDILAWQDRVDEIREAAYRASLKRHRKRNFERKWRGLPLKIWEGESKEEYYNSDEDIGNDDYNSTFPPPKPASTERHIDTDAPEETKLKQSLKQPTVGNSDSLRKRTSAADRSKSPTKQKSPESAPQQRSQPTPAAATATGYQGTSRKPTSTKSASSATGSRAAPAAAPAATAPAKPIRTAKKTQGNSTRKMVKSSQTGVNVFTGGKPIRSRVRLGDNMADKTKDPHLFANHRIRRKAELQGRDKADQAPSSLPAMLFNISSGPPPGSSTSNATTMLRSAMKRWADEGTRSASESSIAASERTESTHPANSEQPQPARPTVKKRKSVQWADAPLVEEPESMDVDDPASRQPKRLRSLSPPPKSPPTDPQHPAPIVRKLSISQYQKRNVGQNVDKAIVLGPAGTKDVHVTFENVRPESDEWHSRFVDHASLHFDKSCNARTFAQKRNTVVERVVSHGNIRAKLPSDEGALNNAAHRLKLGSFGASCFHEGFTVVIYPALCEDWKGVAPEAEAASPVSIALKYFIYKPHQFAIKPLPVRATSPPKPTDLRATILRNVLGLDYHQLTPPGLRGVRHNFYLAFPPSREAMLETLSEWLHVENPSCRVFSTKTSGDWTAFTDPKIVPHGVVIVHEAATDALRLYPGLLKLLLHKQSATYLFWCIGESLQRYPVYPSLRSVHHTTEPGTVELTRFFPHGSAILVTPSFLVAEPRRAFQLFEWYRKTYHKPSNNTKIVAVSSLCTYLRDLALDRAEQRKDLMARGVHTKKSKSTQEEVAQKVNLGHEACAARFETWAIVEDLQRSFLDSIVPDEQLEPFIFADESIDANDEQSLVNWFGCWSQTRFDQFRKFLVLGTDPSSDTGHIIKSENLPVYLPGTEHDPAAEREVKSQVPETSQQSRGSTDQPTGSGSQLLGNTTFWSIKEKLRYLPGGVGTFSKLYGYPISYFRDIPETADSLGDFHREFATYQKWWDFPWPFFSVSQGDRPPPPSLQDRPTVKVFNSYLALFYTPHEGPRDKSQARDPWIAIYRPINPHLKGWQGTELLIWDVTAPGRYLGQDIFEDELTEAQRFLIKFIREHGEQKNQGLPLKQVWMGGFCPAPSEYTSPLDVTLHTLTAMMSDLRTWVPAWDGMLPARGFRSVKSDELRPSEDAQLHLPDPMQLDPAENLHGNEDDLNNKIIFHPPRGPRKGWPSRCENLLYKWVRDVARRDPTRREFAYTFKPTVEWYKEQQVAEGRYFEHISISNWQRVFEIVRVQSIDSAKKEKLEPRADINK